MVLGVGWQWLYVSRCLLVSKVLAAFQQVEDELVALRVLQQQAAAQAAAVAAGQRAVEVTLNQYLAGTVAYTSVVTEQTLLLGKQETLLGVQQSRLTASDTKPLWCMNTLSAASFHLG